MNFCVRDLLHRKMPLIINSSLNFLDSSLSFSSISTKRLEDISLEKIRTILEPSPQNYIEPSLEEVMKLKKIHKAFNSSLQTSLKNYLASPKRLKKIPKIIIPYTPIHREILYKESKNQIIKVMNFILQQCIAIEKEIDGNFYSYYHKEPNIICSSFEDSSNRKIIGLTTKLSTEYIPIILCIFQAKWDNNPWNFQNIIRFISMYDNEISEETIRKLRNYDVSVWINVMNLYYENTYVPERKFCFSSMFTLEDIFNYSVS
jgi:hypothetical protein